MRSFRPVESVILSEAKDPMSASAANDSAGSSLILSLPSCFCRIDLGRTPAELKSQIPRAGRAFAMHLLRGELPAARRGQRQVGKILTRSRGDQLRLRNLARGADLDSHHDFYLSRDGVARTLRHGRQNLLEHCAA